MTSAPTTKRGTRMHWYLIMVIGGFSVFILTLGAYWLRDYLEELGKPPR